MQGQIYFVILVGPSYFCEINQEHFIASYCEEIKDARKWNSEEEAEYFLYQWKDAGIGLNGQVMMICDFGYEE